MVTPMTLGDPNHPKPPNLQEVRTSTVWVVELPVQDTFLEEQRVPLGQQHAREQPWNTGISRCEVA